MGYLGKNIYKTLFSLSALFESDDIKAAAWDRQQYTEAQRYLSKTIDFKEDDIVLDFGCGTGLHERWFAPKVHKVVGLDFVIGMVRRARKNTSDYPNTEIVLHKSEILPFANNTFSRIFCCSVFRYFPNFDYAKNILKEMFRVTKTGGKIFIFDLPDIKKRRFPKNLRGELKAPIEYFLKILSYYFACYYSAEKILNFCYLHGMPAHLVTDDDVFHLYEEGFSCWIEVVK